MPLRLLEWRQGYPSEEMIAAHPSRLWLVKGKCWSVKKLLSLADRIESNELDVYVNSIYVLGKSGKIYLDGSSELYSEYGRDRTEYDFYLYVTGEINIREIDDYGSDDAYDNELVFIGKWDGDSVKQIESTYENVDFISHAETVIKLLQEQGKLQQTEKQRLYAEDYFCPMDEDGNKVPWPNSVAPRGFISWVQWDASKH